MRRSAWTFSSQGASSAGCYSQTRFVIHSAIPLGTRSSRRLGVSRVIALRVNARSNSSEEVFYGNSF